MLLRPISFVCGACASLFVVYLGRIWFFGYDIKTAWTINPLESVNPSIENVEAHANATVPEEVVDRYSIADITSNSTLGVSRHLWHGRIPTDLLSVREDTSDQPAIKV